MRIVLSYLVVAVLAGALTFAVAQRNPIPQPNPPVYYPPPKKTQEPKEEAPKKEEPQKEASNKNPLLEDLSAEEQTNVHVYQRVNRSVVNITTQSVEVDDFLLLARPREGSGSGSILDKKGHILTNNHVVDKARHIAVTLYEGSVYEAELVGADPNNDLAVLKIDVPPEKLVPIAWGNSNDLLVGLRVFAIGNPFGLERTLTTGIISSLNRSLRAKNNRLIRGIIQTDAAINPGNSGGPLLNRQGEMVGITTAIIGNAGQNSGIGLAVPANTAKRVVKELIQFGRVIRPDSGIFSVYELEEGLLIARLTPNGPAEKAGLRGPQIVVVRRNGFVIRGLDRSKADLIVGVDGKKVRSFDDFLSYVESKQPGDQIRVSILREGEKMEIKMTLETS